MHKKRTFKEFNEMLDRLQAADPLHGSRAVTEEGNLLATYHGSPNRLTHISLAEANEDQKRLFTTKNPFFATIFSGDKPEPVLDPINAIPTPKKKWRKKPGRGG